jgi:hypothetical protein
MEFKGHIYINEETDDIITAVDSIIIDRVAIKPAIKYFKVFPDIEIKEKK